MGERAQGTLFEPNFNRAVRVEPAPIALTEDAGALALREAAEQVGMVLPLGNLWDPRNPAFITHPMSEMVLSRVFLIALGWRDQDDADALRKDPALRVAVSERRGTRPLDPPRNLEPAGLASQPTLSRLTDTLAVDANLSKLRRILRDVGVARLRDEGVTEEVVLDVDSLPLVAHGQQEGAVYNGHYHDTVLHPLAVFAHTGDLLAFELRPGNVHTAHEVREVLAPVIGAVELLVQTVWVRVDAGFAAGHFFDWLDAREVQWLTRLRTNEALKSRCEDWVQRTEQRWAEDAYVDELRTETFEFSHKASPWTRPRRVVAVLVERNGRQGELFHNLFFLCTSASPSEATSTDVLERYRKRGRAEASIGEFVNETRPSLSSTALDHNQVNALLAALAYQLLQHIRRRLVATTGEGLSLRRLRERVLKVATQVVKHARRMVFRISGVKAAAWQLLRQALAPPIPWPTEGTAAS